MLPISFSRAQIQCLPRWAWGMAAILPVTAAAWGFSAVKHTPRRVSKPVVKVAGTRQEKVKVPKSTLPVAAVLAKPKAYFGDDIHGTAMITRMEGERAFWVKANGKRAFVVMSEQLGAAPEEIAVGRRIKLQGRVWNPARMAEIPEVTQLDELSLDRIRSERAILEATHLKWTGL